MSDRESFPGFVSTGEGDHPDPQVLGLYHDGALTAAQEDQVREHLAGCRECADFLLDLEDFVLLQEDEDLSAEETERDRQRLMAALAPGSGEPSREAAGDPAAGSAAPPPAVRTTRRSAGSASSFLRLAASFLLVSTLALLGWNLTLQQERSAPSGDVFLLEDLRPDVRRAAPRAAEEGVRTDAVPRWADRVHLLLNVGQPLDHAAYRAEIREGGQRVWSGAVHRPERGNFSLVVPRGVVVDRVLEVSLLGVAPDGSEETLATYTLHLQEP